jgi:hypothetical protein
VPNEKPLTDNGEKTPSPQPTQNNLTSSVANTTNSSKKLAPIPDLSFPNCPTAAQYGDPLFGSPLYGHSWATWEKEGMGKAYQVLISTKNHEQACKQSYENLQIPFLQKVLPRLIIQLVDEVKQISQGVWEENSFARVLPLILVLEKKYQELVIKGCGKLFAVQFQHQCAEFADFLFKELAHQKGYGFFQYLLDPAQRASIDNENIEQLFASRVESDSIERKQACSFLLFLREQSFSSTPEPLSSEPTPLPYYPQVEGHSKEVWAAKGKLEDYYAQAPSVTKRQAVTAKYHNEQRPFLDKTLPGLSKIIMEEIDKVNEGTAWDRNSFEIVIDSLIHIEKNYRDLGSEYWFKREFHKEFKLTHDLFFQNLAHVDEDTYLDYYESPDRDNIDFTNLNNLMDSLESPERPYCEMDRNACSFLLFIRKEYPNYCDG